MSRFIPKALDYLKDLVSSTTDEEVLAIFVGFDESGVLDGRHFSNLKSHAHALIIAARDPETDLDCVRGLAMSQFIKKAKQL